MSCPHVPGFEVRPLKMEAAAAWPRKANRQRRIRVACFIGAVLLGAAWSSAGAFEQAFDAPAFVVSAPGIPNIRLAAVAPPGSQTGIAARGRDDTYSIEVTALASSQAGSTRSCAGQFLRDLVKRPHMPDRDSIYRAPFDINTFLVLYILEQPGPKVLHAHLVSAAAGTHCIDAHFSRNMKAGEDEDAWRTTFAGARVREGAR